VIYLFDSIEIYLQNIDYHNFKVLKIYLFLSLD